MKSGKKNISVVYNQKTKKYLKCQDLWKSPTEWVLLLNDATHYPHTKDDMEDLLSSSFYDWPFPDCIIKSL